MSKLREAAQQALEDVCGAKLCEVNSMSSRQEMLRLMGNAITTLRTAIGQAEKQEPVAWRTFDGEGGYDYRTYDDNENYRDDWNKRNPNHKGWVDPLYTTPPRREWQGLTEEGLAELARQEELLLICDDFDALREIARAVEAKLKEKNT